MTAITSSGVVTNLSVTPYRQKRGWTMDRKTAAVYSSTLYLDIRNLLLVFMNGKVDLAH